VLLRALCDLKKTGHKEHNGPQSPLRACTIELQSVQVSDTTEAK